MSILTVDHVDHDFGGRQILEDASFRLLKGEHVGLVGANGEGKSTFLNIITGKLRPDAGKVEWCKRVTTGYLDLDHIEWLKDYLINYENAFILVSHDISFLNEVTNVTYHVEEARLTRYAGNYDYLSNNML